MLRTPPPTVSGMKQASAVRCTDIEQCPATLVTCRNIEKAEFIGACGIIGDGAFDGIAGITKIDEIDALHHASLFHVEAGYDARFKHARGS